MSDKVKVEVGQLWSDGHNNCTIVAVDYEKKNCTAIQNGNRYKKWGHLTEEGFPSGWIYSQYKGIDETFCPHDCCK
jgi:hypothetical protein